MDNDGDRDDNRYVPRNMPAIGDLMDMFQFGDRDDRDDRDHRGDRDDHDRRDG
jgi:phospholipase C